MERQDAHPAQCYTYDRLLEDEAVPETNSNRYRHARRRSTEAAQRTRKVDTDRPGRETEALRPAAHTGRIRVRVGAASGDQ